MKPRFLIYFLFIGGLMCFLLYSCKKNASALIPMVTTGFVTNLTATSAICPGEISFDGGSSVISRGVCWGFNPDPTISDNKTSEGIGSGVFNCFITGLTPAKTYYIRAYATNGVGTGYGAQSTFTTLSLSPQLTTSAISVITSTTANSGGSIANDGGSPITSCGVCWSIDPIIPTAALSTKTVDVQTSGIFSSIISGLIPGTKYNVVAYATNNTGTGYGSVQTFTSAASFPTLSTSALSNKASNSVTSGGTVTTDGGSAVISRGVCWSTNNNPTVDLSTKTVDGNGIGPFLSNANNLSPFTTYYMRAYATNSFGTGYGNVYVFTTPRQVTDFEGNIYHTIAIGPQVWLLENLKTTKYRNGDPIPNITGGIPWTIQTTGAFCIYNNNAANTAIYGNLYNWYALNDARGLAPSGWHVPTLTEWIALQYYCGEMQTAGGKLKETGYSHWNAPNTGATNSSGFTALPSGFCGGQNGGICFGMGVNATFWSADENGVNDAWSVGLTNSTSIFYGSGGNKPTGYAIRCVIN